MPFENGLPTIVDSWRKLSTLKPETFKVNEQEVKPLGAFTRGSLILPLTLEINFLGRRVVATPEASHLLYGLLMQWAAQTFRKGLEVIYFHPAVSAMELRNLVIFGHGPGTGASSDPTIALAESIVNRVEHIGWLDWLPE